MVTSFSLNSNNLLFILIFFYFLSHMKMEMEMKEKSPRKSRKTFATDTLRILNNRMLYYRKMLKKLFKDKEIITSCNTTFIR